MLKKLIFTCIALSGCLQGCSSPPVPPISQKIRLDEAEDLARANLAQLDKLSPDRLMKHASDDEDIGSQCMDEGLNITQGKLVASESVLLNSTVKIQFRSSVYCTGTLVGPRQVITAAHCLKGETPTEVRFGKEPDTAPEYIATVKWWVNHPDYYNTWDLAVIVLNFDVPARYRYARIANPNTLKDGMIIYYAGYGSISETKKTYTNPMAWTAVGLESIDKDRKTFSTKIDGRGSCYGDSGGPGYVMDESNSCLLAVGVVNTASTRGGGDCGQGDTSFDLTQATGWIGETFKILSAPLPYSLPIDGTEFGVSRNILGAPLPE